jgi:hypothetical protein
MFRVVEHGPDILGFMMGFILPPESMLMKFVLLAANQ